MTSEPYTCPDCGVSDFTPHAGENGCRYCGGYLAESELERLRAAAQWVVDEGAANVEGDQRLREALGM